MELRGIGDSDSETSDSEFSSDGLAERLAEWVASDDQVSSVSHASNDITKTELVTCYRH